MFDQASVSESAAAMERQLLGDALADTLDMVLRPLGPNHYRVATRRGAVEFRRVERDGRYHYETLAVEGDDPIADSATFPHAHDSVAQLFDSPMAPDLVATHHDDHAYDGNIGQHGSLSATQARAPFIAAGAGIRRAGYLDASARMVDVAPTIATLLGLDPHPEGIGPTGRPRPDALLRRQDGDPIDAVLDGSRAEHVMVILLDGCNPDLLRDCVEAGDAPNVASLLERGTALAGGLFASLPTATLANHNTAVTGAHPGHSGVLHNDWIDRDNNLTVNLLSMDQIFWASQHISPEVETLFEAVHRNDPGAICSATFEFCDRGADVSSFAEVREGGIPPVPELHEITQVDSDAAARSEAYAFMSRVDHLSVQQTLRCWDEPIDGRIPTLSWCSMALTDEAGHESGPWGDLARRAVRDCDARIGLLLAAIDRAGVRGSTAVIVLADHGMHQADPTLTRPWDQDLAAITVPHRVVGDGFVYLDAAATVQRISDARRRRAPKDEPGGHDDE